MIDLRTERNAGERALFVGNTGSGKTVLIQALAAPMRSCVIFDSKHEQAWQDYAEQFGYVVSGDPVAIRRHPRVVFRVDTRSLRDRAGWSRPGSVGAVWTDALLSLWYRTGEGAGSTLVIFDEGADTLPSEGGTHPEADRIATSGRTQGLPMWAGAQLPVYISKRVLSQAEHCFSFAQPMPEYRDLLRQRRGVNTDVLAELDPEAHEFAHHRIGQSTWHEFGAVTPVTKGATRHPAEYAEGAPTAVDEPLTVSEPAPTLQENAATAP